MSWIDGYVFPLDDDVRMAQDTARSFAEKEVRPLASKIDLEHYYPKELIPKMGGLGFMGAFVPPELEGAGLSHLAYALIIEELAAVCASTAIIVSAHNSLCVWPILNYGTDSQKERYIPPLSRGEHLGCFALSEPGTGSDAASLTCTVTKKGGRYVINGAKNWITNGPVADTCVVFATHDPSKGHKGVSAFVLSLGLPGIIKGKKEDKLGIRGSPTCGITFDNVELTEENLLFEEGRGFAVAMNTLNGGRIGVAAQAVGIARSALRDALAYSKERRSFGVPICEHQSIQNYLAEMVCGIDSARYLTLGAARLKDLGRPHIRESAMAKLVASQAAVFAGDRCVQIHGGYGYVTDYPAERHLRDAKITEIYEGTTEIHKMVIAGSLIKE